MNGHDDKNGREDGGREDGAPDAGDRRAAQRVADGYRSATTALDERPSAHARAAILAAAAREVGAQPRDAAAGPPPARSPHARSALRWPMAAAATVLLSSVAVMMASRVEEAQQMAESAAPSLAAPPVASPTAPPVAAPSAPPAAGPAAPPVAPPSTPASRAPMADSGSARENAAPIAPVPPRRADPEKSAAAPPTIAQSAEQPAARSSAQSAPPAAPVAPQSAVPAPFADAPRERSVTQAPPPAPPIAPPPAAAAAESSAPSTTAGAAGGLSRDMATLRKPEAQTQERSRLEARSAPGAALGAAQRADTALPDSDEATLSADDWLARIVRLRDAGRHAEADAQLQRFRQRYPQVKVPEAALPPTGTR